MNPNFFATNFADALSRIAQGFGEFCMAVLANPIAFWMIFAFVAVGVARGEAAHPPASAPSVSGMLRI